jgi:penicillin-binding protein 1C
MGKTGRYDWRTFLISRRAAYAWIALLGGLLAYGWALPDPLFDKPLSFVLEDRQGRLLGAKIAPDGQWRFPAADSLPIAYVQALIAFEDQRFFRHPGVDVLSLGRALLQNLRAGKVVSGGSTLSMQVMRMALGHRKRNLPNKIIEMILATRLEIAFSKQEILLHYATHAPFGGNIVGLEAACWRYFHKTPRQLSWGEAALLAVLPNSPGLIHPGKNRDRLLQKRNRLLQKLRQKGTLDELTYQLSLEEPLPDKVFPLPAVAPHFLEKAYSDFRHQTFRVRSTLDLDLQTRMAHILERHHQVLRLNQIHNLSALVIDVATRQPLVYIGNITANNNGHQEQVDVIQAPRSSGSILKPLLAAFAMQEGILLPQSLLPDVPTNFNGYRPENFKTAYDGLISTEKALVRSLNIPFVYLLQEFGTEKFLYQLQKAGFSTLRFPASHYGLTAILGGAEVKLWDVCYAYTGMARTLRYFAERNSKYVLDDFRPVAPRLPMPAVAEQLQNNPPLIGAGASWLALRAMQEVERPDQFGQWQRFASAQNIAWKTGTSFGFKDAWAVGINGDYVIGVWAGNADGEGRPLLTGISAAAPVLFELFELLPSIYKFEPPYDDLVNLDICRESGYRAGRHCPVVSTWGPPQAVRLPHCSYHKTIFLSADEKYQVHRGCAGEENLTEKVVFQAPPLESHYYRQKNPQHLALPPFRSDCVDEGSSGQIMDLIYPKPGAKIYVPLDIDGKPSRTVFEVAHRQPEKTIFWHLDQQYLGLTRNLHTMELYPEAGTHRLILVDENGRRLECSFQILSGK